MRYAVNTLENEKIVARKKFRSRRSDQEHIAKTLRPGQEKVLIDLKRK